MDTIDLCDTDSEESIHLSLGKTATIECNGMLLSCKNQLSPKALHMNENYDYSSGNDESKDDDSLLSLEDSSLPKKSFFVCDTRSCRKSGENTSPEFKSSDRTSDRGKNVPRGIDRGIDFAEPSKRKAHQNLGRKRARELEYTDTKVASNKVIEIGDDKDDEHSTASFEDKYKFPIRKKLFSGIQYTAAASDSSSRDCSEEDKNVMSPLDSVTNRDKKSHGLEPDSKLAPSSGVVDLLSSGDEESLDPSPKNSFTSSKQSLHKLSNHPANITTDHEETKNSLHSEGIANGIDFVCDSDSDDSSLLSPSCFARKSKSVKYFSRHAEVIKEHTSVSATTSDLNSNSVVQVDLLDESNLLSPSCLTCESMLIKDSTIVTRPMHKRHDHTNISATIPILNYRNSVQINSPEKLNLSTTEKINHEKSFEKLGDNMILGDNLIPTTPNNPTRRYEKVPTPRIPVKGIGGRLYPDYRNQFITALITHAKITRRAIHQRGVLDSSIRAVIIFSIYRFPIRTAEAGSRIKGIGKELLSVLRDAEKTCKREPCNPPRGKFSSVAASTLVALLAYEEENPGETLCTMEELIRRINQLTHHTGSSSVLNRNTAYYLDKNTLDPGWMQVKKLGSNHASAGLEAMIKERRKKGACQSGVVFELVANGRNIAIDLKHSLELGPVEAGPLRQLASDVVDKDFGNVTLSMDFREGGGGSKSLHKMCDLLDEYRVPYVVRNLKISDYVYFIGDKLAPILIERKSVDDVACSLADGRWKRQQQSMRKAQYVLGNGAERKCQICYLIEGDATRRTVHGGKVGRVSWNQTLKDVENAIAKLPGLGFSVMKSRSHMGSMKILTQIARDVLWKHRNGSIACKYTYQEFLKELKRCEDKEGDPPTLREHQYPAAPVVNTLSLQHDTSTGIEIGSSNGVISGENDECCSDEIKQKTEDLMKLPISNLKLMCKDRDDKVSGNKKELIKRLLKKRKPEILITRSRRGQYNPKVPSCNAAIIVALLLHHIPGTEGLSKEKIMLLAEETGISKDPMGGNGGWYDGWASIKEMISGDPPLVCVSKRKYSLTTQPHGAAGVDVAKAIHILAHRENICQCGQYVTI